MSAKLLKILNRLSRELREIDFDSEEILDDFDYEETDFDELLDGLKALESAENIGEEKLDFLKAVLVYILIKDNSYDSDEIFALIFGGGKRIIWN